MNNPFDYTPGEECDRAFEALLSRLDSLKESSAVADVAFCRELQAGKMLGVLIAVDADGGRHTLYAFSGQIGDGGFCFPGFVGPVFDYLQPGGFFKTSEAAISRLNAEIAAYEVETYAVIKRNYEKAREKLTARVDAYKEECIRSKALRDARRQAGKLDESEVSAMVKQSQFEKAQLRRLRKQAEASLEPFATSLSQVQAHLDAMKEKRRAASESLQHWLFSNFTLLNARGQSKSVSEIFAGTTLKIAPSGAGECCAPKLLQAAYRLGWKPIEMAEYWYGRPKGGEIRRHGQHYPACRGKCLPVLNWMLQGLDVQPPLDTSHTVAVDTFIPRVIFENQWFCVVDKPAGMLSVPGKDAAISLQQWLTEKYGAGRQVRMAHRLDQDTSGIIIATFGQEAYKIMQSLFAMRQVKKTYEAELEGDYRVRDILPQGRIELPLSPDVLDRPRQRVDHDGGKPSVTDYRFVDTDGTCSRIIFHPLTGRTHQLRVHAASVAGLGMPIVGDRLYGHTPAPRLHLHAQHIEFTFPKDGRHYSFHVPTPF